MHSTPLDFPYVLSECEEINSILYKPINLTQRIKYTCFNVSSSYIILGSTSGSIYLFSREPCLFLQIIPLSEGMVSSMAISPNEKTVALATNRGTVCLVSLKPTSRLIAISAGHIYEQITCLQWNNNSTEIYFGDAAGRVSVMILSIFTVNGIFQAPTCTLMSLDSSIVQLNFCSPLLLVSTLTRCYICDTVREQYKQIGNKTRNGEFGACFYKTHLHENSATLNQKEMGNINTRGMFNLISDNDSNVLDENHPMIFCARPGSRLWEVSADGVVMKTHQFKEALAVCPMMIFRPTTLISNHEKEEEEKKKETERDWPPQSINFSHLCTIACKYLFSYTTNGLYVVDPTYASIVLWNNEFININMTTVVGDKIYLMTCDSKFHCLQLSSLNALILRLYCQNEYRECLRACIVYRTHLSKAIAITREIVELENLPRTLRDEALAQQLRPLITLLRSGDNSRPVKLYSGIVVVNPENMFISDKEMCNYEMKSTLQSSDISSENSSKIQILTAKQNLDENLQRKEHEIIEKKVIDNGTETTSVISDGQKSDLREKMTPRVQSDLATIYTLVNSIRMSMSEKEIEKIIIDLDRRMRMIRESYKDSLGLQSFICEITRAAELHYHNVFLENISVQLLRSTDNDHIVRQSTRAFTEINAPIYMRCDCGYPFPMNKNIIKPKFSVIGESLIRRFIDDLPEECSAICNKVPYMWREYLAARIERRNSLDDILRQCLQTRDNVTLSVLLPALNEQQWINVDACLSEIKNGTCLFCATPLKKKPDCDILLDWNEIAREIMKKQGPDEATAFLIKLQSVMPDVTLDRSIFQSIIFTKILHHRGLKKSIDFSHNNQLSSKFGIMCSLQVRDHLIKAIEKDLRRPMNKNAFGTGAHHWGVRHQTRSLICPCCTLSLQTPILLGNNGIAIFRCGHVYHVNCMIERKLTRCNLHQ